ncbi:PH domain-containing protein [Lentilactobacillus raoultii]|uniref:PH domain-containing protein n=1 Tax=Lentilactobacillus raoultii TaxID=1987503 RepID=A0ABW3PLH5_9LACO|nr:PH domain-containing protein [Lentilactobacillus raoultii]
MMSETPKQHLSLFSLFYYAAKGLANWGLLILVFMPAQNALTDLHLNVLMVVSGLLGLIIGWGLLKFYFFTFQISDEMITINSGILIKRHTHIPYGRIQTIQRNQWFFLKPLHLEQLKIETAGHDSHRPEVVLPVVAETVRQQIEQKRAAIKSPLTQPQSTSPSETITPVSATAATDRQSYRINTHDLNIFALTSFGFLPLLGILFAIYGKLQDYLPQHLLNTVTNELVSQSILIIALVVGFLVMIAIIGSYLSLIQKYYQFTLTAQPGQLKTYRGLFQRSSITIPLDRIQALKIKQNVLRQWAKLATIQALAASSAGDDDKGNDMIILPVIKTRELFDRLHQFVTWVPTAQIQLNQLPKRHHYYFIRNAILIALVPVIGCLYFLKLWGLLSLPLLIIAFFLGWYAANNVGWQIHQKLLIMQTGSLFTRTEFIVPKKNVQSFSLDQSIWMARKSLAHIRVNVRHGNHNEQISVRYLPLKDAQMIFEWLKIRN